MLRHGNAKALPLPSVESLDAVLGPVDDKPNENDPAVANASALPAAASIPARGMDCEGGVCKLVRKQTVSTPEQAPSGTPEVGGGGVKEAVAVAAASGPAPPAAPVRGMDCEGGVCKLVRKKKAPAPEQPPSAGTPEAEATVAVAAADPPSSPAPARAMDCEGGVCKLVRKKTPAAIAAAAAAPESVAAEEAEGPLVVGGDMPSLRVRRRFGCDESTPSASPSRPCLIRLRVNSCAP